jgi:elongation factor 1-gamma
MAIAKMGGLELEIPQGFDYGVTNKTPEFLAKFPLGKFPTLETSSGFLLFETTAIAEYVAKNTPIRDQLVGGTLEEQAIVQQWLWFGENHLYAAGIPLISWRMGYGQYDEKTEEKSKGELKRYLDFIESHLKGGRKFIASETSVTVADLHIADAVFLLFATYVDAEMRKEYPSIVRWFETIKGIPEITDLYTCDWIETRKEPTESGSA